MLTYDKIEKRYLTMSDRKCFPSNGARIELRNSDTFRFLKDFFAEQDLTMGA